MQDDVKVRWNTGVKCEQCDNSLEASIDRMSKGFTAYLYHCKHCDVSGPWTALATRIVGNRGKRYGRKKSFK